MRLTTRYRFAASHRLATPALSEEENRRIYGKCNNPFGHGHDYVLEVTVEGPVDESGQVVRRHDLDELIHRRVLGLLDHKDLNTDVAGFSGRVTTTENLTSLVRAELEQHWTLAPRLAALRISETPRNSFTWESSR